MEHGLNSSDNAVLGMDWKWNFMNRFSFYGQFILDEFIKDEMFGRTQSWVNKWGYQAGIKYINVANINNLDLQLEVTNLDHTCINTDQNLKTGHIIISHSLIRWAPICVSL